MSTTLPERLMISRLIMSTTKTLGNKLCRLLVQAGELVEDIKRSSKNLDTRYMGMYADLQIHNFLSTELLKIYQAPVVSEEKSSSHSQNYEEYWLVDPVDGTASFSNGFKGYVVQCCLIKDGDVLMAGIYAPHFKKLYFSIKGHGVYINNKKLEKRNDFGASLSIVDNEPTPHGIAKYICSIMDISLYIESGSLGLKLCLVAEGAASIFIKSTRVRDWDIAPASLLIAELGGNLTDMYGEYVYYKPGIRTHKGLIACMDQNLHRQIVFYAKGYTENEI